MHPARPGRRVALTGLLGLAAGLPALGGCTAVPVQTFADLAAARRAIDALSAPGVRKAGGFTLAQMLHHAAQSVEFSIDGFPQAYSTLFRHTAGSAAWAWFDTRGAMQHDLSEPIPGAPPLAEFAAAEALPAAAQRLHGALARFEAHRGALAPHFAYGSLDKPQYLRAHLMHLANHWTEVTSA